MLYKGLSLELFQLIISYLPNVSDLFHLSLVSRSLNRAVIPKLYETVTIYTRRRSIQHMRNKEPFGKNLARYIRKIHVVAPIEDRWTDVCAHDEGKSQADITRERHTVQCLGTEIINLCNEMPKNQLLEFVWSMGTCVPANLLGPQGFFVEQQQNIRRLSLLTNCACWDSGTKLGLSSFKGVRELFWSDMRGAKDVENLMHCIKANSLHLESLHLGICTFNFVQLRHGRAETQWNLITDDVKSFQQTPSSVVFPALRSLDLSYVSFHRLADNMISAFNFTNLRTLKLWGCQDQFQLLKNIADLRADLHLQRFELIFDEHGATMDDNFIILKNFLKSFDGLQDLYLMVGTFEGRPGFGELAKAIAFHKNTLSRLVVHLRVADLDPDSERLESNEDYHIEWIEDHTEILHFPLLQYYGVTFDYASIEAILAHMENKPTWKIFHARFTRKRGVSSRRRRRRARDNIPSEYTENLDVADPDGKPLHLYLKKFKSNLEGEPLCFDDVLGKMMRSGSLPVCTLEFLKFAQWIFGPQGLPELQILAWGDFSYWGEYAPDEGSFASCFLCRSIPSQAVNPIVQDEVPQVQLNFRAVAEEDVHLQSLIRDNMDFLSACEVYKTTPGFRIDR